MSSSRCQGKSFSIFRSHFVGKEAEAQRGKQQREELSLQIFWSSIISSSLPLHPRVLRSLFCWLVLSSRPALSAKKTPSDRTTEAKGIRSQIKHRVTEQTCREVWASGIGEHIQNCVHRHGGDTECPVGTFVHIHACIHGFIQQTSAKWLPYAGHWGCKDNTGEPILARVVHRRGASRCTRETSFVVW